MTRFAIVENHFVVNVAIAGASQGDNWIASDVAGPGWVESGGVLTAPAEAPTPPPDPRIWWIDEGPFMDRLGMDALTIAASSDGVCKAVNRMVSGRKYIDLKDQRVADMLGLLALNSQPAADPRFPGSGPMTPDKIGVILTTPTVEDERHVKGLG